MIEELFSVVTTNEKSETVERYLYEPTVIVDERVVESDNKSWHTVRVLALKTTSQVGNAAFLRQYQLDRLASGLIYGVPVASLDEANAKLAEAEKKEYF